MSGLPGTGTSPQDAFGADPPNEGARKAGYGLAILLAVLSFAAPAIWVWQGFGDLDDSVGELQRLDIPGQRTFSLQEGKQSVYYEGEGTGNIRFAIVGADGVEVPISQHGGEVTYDIAGHSGESVFGYEIEQAGDYEVSVQGALGGQVAFGDGVGGQIVRIVVGGLVLFFGLGAVAIVLLVRTRRRRRAA